MLSIIRDPSVEASKVHPLHCTACCMNALQGSSDALDKTAFTDTLTALLADPALDEAGKGAGGSSEAAPGDSIPDVAGYLRVRMCAGCLRMRM